LYRPYVWEFSRLNITHTMLSKRKILKLVEEKKVRGWDDPRLATINGLRRRGYAPEAINAFCRNIGVTRNENTILMSKLEHFLREHLDMTARRAFAVLHPLKVTCTNVDPTSVQWVEAPDFPRDKALGMHKMAISNVVYIEKDDFRLKDDKDYYGLAPLGKVAGLRYGGYLKVESIALKDVATGAVSKISATDAAAVDAAAAAVASGASEVVELFCDYDHERTDRLTGSSKVKGNLHWVSSSVPGKEPATAEVRLYTHLFTTEEPGSTGDWEAEIDPNSEVVLAKCYVDDSLAHPAAAHGGRLHPITDRFQFERLGYFVVDTDTDFDSGKLVFNQTVSLKEDAAVKKIKGSS
jgi:glutaminyl-tRNA synthetase